MSFQTGLSGLNASSKNLDVIGHNIANANTVGSKVSRTEFAEVVASAIGPSGGGGAGGSGIGTRVATVSQQFSQGNISITGNSLDLAVNGGGFFQITKPDGSAAYSRDGQFKLDSSGNIITNRGAQLMGYPTDLDGNTTSTTLQALSIPTGAPVPAQATTEITAAFNLDTRASIYNAVTPNTPLTKYGTSLTNFDAQGSETPLSVAFRKTAADQWEVFNVTSGTVTTAPIARLHYSASGALTTVDLPNADWGGGAGTWTAGTGTATAVPVTLTSPNVNIGNFAATIDISNTTQYGTDFAISSLSQDGYTAGNLTGVSVSDAGIITTRYSNGQTQARGQVALADFRNVQGLKPDSDGWVETSVSGQPISGSPGTGNLGDIRSGALEDSNIDLTSELVNMMTAQRNYQANAQTIKTQDQAMQTLVNLR